MNSQHKDLIQESLVAEKQLRITVSKRKFCSLKSSNVTKFKGTNTLAKHSNLSTNFALTSFAVRGYPNHFDSGDRHLQRGGRKQGAVIQLEFPPSPRVVKLHLRPGRRLKFRLIGNSKKLPLRYHCLCNYSRRMRILSTKVQSDETAPKLFLRSQSRKWITVKPHGKQYKSWLCEESSKTLLLHFNIF